jgi:hypothetical protein
MAHWAEVDENNIVTRVLVIDDNTTEEHEGYQWLVDNLGGTWVRTSYNTIRGVHLNGKEPFRYNYAGIGYYFDSEAGEDGAFIPEKPYDSWILDTEMYDWISPISYPTDGKVYVWDEENVSWHDLGDIIQDEEPPVDYNP